MNEQRDVSIARRSVSGWAARSLVDAAINYAEERQWSIAVGVVDAAGNILALARMDSATSTIADFALDKAYTASMVNKSTRAFFERMASSPELAMGLANRRRLLCWEGGLPITLQGQIIGGIGVSGATGPEDAECAMAALTALGLGLQEV